MTNAISIIKDEHRSMASVVKGLQAHLADVAAGRTRPDFHLAAAMLDYIQAVPERLHHPKEDEYLFRLLRLRCTESHAVLDELERQHVQGAELLAGLRSALDAYRESGDADAFGRTLAAYADFQWQHMRTEEEVVLPLAQRHLSAEDWQTIGAAFQINQDRSW